MNFSNYYTHEAIFKLLCKHRCKVASKRNKLHFYLDHLKDKKVSESSEDLFLMSLFPSRRKWLKLKPKLRNDENGFAKTSTIRNMISLKLTVKYYRENEPKAEFLVRLDNYIAEIQKCFCINSFFLTKPEVVPEFKKKKDDINICRPLSVYKLTEKIVLSITNRYAVEIFDKIFKDCGFAFRANKDIPGLNRAPNHIDAFQEIIKFREKHSNEIIWGAECDMSKFFDTVNHSFVIKRFDQFIKQKFFKQYREEDLLLLRYILKEYLRSYTFNKYVRSISCDQEYFEKYNIKNGRFEWVEKEFLEKSLYKDVNKAKIGIPQGGALSGFIANILLHDSDRAVLKKLDKDSVYLRFCDDMIILSTNKSNCEISYRAYTDSLTKNKLVVHDHVGPSFQDASEFWSSKSKLSYRWGEDENKDTYWVGFVGLEINYRGEIRIRRSTLKKELQKQSDLMLEMKRILKNKKRISSVSSVFGSLQKRLVSMSVGRIDLWNYKSYPNEMSWTKGFKILNDNIHARNQLKRLDRSRSLKIHKLKKFITKNYAEEESSASNEKEENTGKRSFQIKHYGKPYSYYYNILKKKL